jgi:hypothetical protein
MRLLLIITCCLCLYISATAQSVYVPLQSYGMHVIDRMEIKQGKLADPSLFMTNNKSYLRKNIALYADSLLKSELKLSDQDVFNLEFLQNDNLEHTETEKRLSKKRIGKTNLYKHPAAMYAVAIPDFDLIINPQLYIMPEFDRALIGNQPHFFQRGLEIRGRVGNKLGFYTSLIEEIQRMNTWNRTFYRENQVIAGNNFIYTSAVPNPNDTANYSYWVHEAYLAYQANKYIDLQFGHGNHFFGNGYRTFMRSDFSTNSLFLRSNTRIWKIHYSNIWGGMYDFNPFSTRFNYIQRKFYATTHASINITNKLNIGLFETTIFNRDSGFEARGYDPQYFVPIIYYNAIDNARNSPDKNLVGIDFKYNFAKHFSLYGQMMISEMNLRRRFKGDGWWGNNEAYQIGLKYIDVLNISNLDMQWEYNQAAPYMYTSFNPRNSYTNFNQSMAHPLGANFREGIFIIKWQPSKRFTTQSMLIYSFMGNDTNGSNWGRNIGLSYFTRMNETGNYIGQGVKTQLFIAENVFSYMYRHNLFFDLHLVYRNQTSDLRIFESNTIYVALGLRWNVALRQCNF